MHPTIQKIIDKLSKYPDAKYDATDDSITIHSKDKNGFEVSLAVGNEFVVSSGVWHEHFVDENEAVNCFAFLLSDSCRMKIEYRGEKPTRWTMESFDNEEWVEYSTTGMFTMNFWATARIEFFQNSLIKSRE